MTKRIILDVEEVKKRCLHLIFTHRKYASILAKEFNVGILTIQRMLCKQDMHRSEILYDPNQPFNQRLIKMYQTMSLKVVGKKLGLNVETLRKRLIRMGIERHSMSFKNYDYIKASNRPDLQGWVLNQLIKKEYEKTRSVKQTMINIGLGDLGTVRNRLRSMGYNTNHRQGFKIKFETRKDKIMQEYSYGHSLKYIAWKLKISSATVANWLEQLRIRKKGGSSKQITLLELAEMQPDHPKILQAKRTFYWYMKGYKMEDVAMMEGIYLNKVSCILKKLNLNAAIRRRQGKRYVYSDHMITMREYVTSNSKEYHRKIDLQICRLEQKQMTQKTLTKLLHPILSMVLPGGRYNRRIIPGKIKSEIVKEESLESAKRKGISWVAVEN